MSSFEAKDLKKASRILDEKLSLFDLKEDQKSAYKLEARKRSLLQRIKDLFFG